MTDSPQYPPHPWRIWLAMALGLASFTFFTHLWKQRAPLLQGEYVTDYIRLSLPAVPGWNQYELVYKGDYLALPTDTGHLVRRYERVDRDKLKAWLLANIYDGKTLPWVLFWPLSGTGLIFLPSLIVAIRLTRKANREARDGRLLRGPKIVSHWKWNLRTLFRRRGAFYIETK